MCSFFSDSWLSSIGEAYSKEFAHTIITPLRVPQSFKCNMSGFLLGKEEDGIGSFNLKYLVALQLQSLGNKIGKDKEHLVWIAQFCEN